MSPPSPRPPLPRGACVLVFNDDAQVLAVNRPSRPQDLCLPGGKLEPGESFLEAAERELYEETGLQVSQDYLVEVYRGECDSGGPGQAYDVTLFAWTGVAGGTGMAVPGSTEPELVARFVDPQALLDASPFHGFNRAGFKAAIAELELVLTWGRLLDAERVALRKAQQRLGALAAAVNAQVAAA